ncbi:MAG TPA: hypothetical protein PLL77_08835 [Pyrinomonadaceae bacterium]|nr:hypothetical protein [Pyrinomonadaceae bacterium]
MNLKRGLGLFVLSTIISTLVIPAALVMPVAAQTQDGVALQRGYRTGYSDGYMAGYRDTIDSVAKSYSRHADYGKANRAYNKDYGTIEDYKDGYQQGFEAGYDTGFERRGFDANLPTNLKRRGGVLVGESQNVAVQTVTPNTTQTSGTTAEAVTVQNNNNNGSGYSNTSYQTDTTQTTATYPDNSAATILIPRDTELIIELQDDLSTDRSRTGDKFTAKIISPTEIAGATVEGRVQKIQAPGRLKRRSELALTFDRIILTDNRWSNFNGTLMEVVAVKGDNVQRVDNEGTAVGKSSLKSDIIKIGASTGVGAVTGAIIGPIGAGVGAAMGAAFGVGAVVIERGKHVKLSRNQQLRIKTSYETQIR